MKHTSVSISYSCKFNDPQKRYMNHNLTAEATATVEEGEDPEQIRQKLANDLEAFVHRRRADLYKVAELEAQFTEMKRDFKYAVDNIRHYEEGTRKAREQMEKANGMYEQLQDVAASLAKLGMTVELIPHLFHTSNNLPSGQRGIYGRWRVGSVLTNADAARVLNVT